MTIKEDAVSIPIREDVLERVIAIIVVMFEMSDEDLVDITEETGIGADDGLRLDPIDLPDFVMRVEDDFGIELDFDEVGGGTVGDLVDLILTKLEQAESGSGTTTPPTTSF